MSLAYLYDPNKQFIDRDGGVNVGGFLRVYLNGTDDHATTYKNFEGTLNAEDIVLDNNGRAVVICEESQYYRIEVYNRSGGMLWTQYPIKPESGSSSLQRINIFSSDHSVDVEENYDAQNDSFNVDLSVKYDNLIDKPISALSCRGGERPSYRGETWELNLWQNPDWIEGDKISVELTELPSAYFIYVPNGVCMVSGYYEFTWDDSVQLRNEIVNLEGTPFDLSYYHSQIVPFHFVKRYATPGGGTNKFGFTPNRTDWPTGIKYWVKKLSLVYLGEL